LGPWLRARAAVNHIHRARSLPKIPHQIAATDLRAMIRRG